MKIHVFNPSSKHLTKLIIAGLHELYHKENRYILLGNISETSKKEHIEYLEERGVKNYSFILSKKAYLKFLFKNRNEHFILHGMSYSCIFLTTTICGKTDWICWGAGAHINKSNFKSRLMTPVKLLLYHRLNRIITLMSGDSLSLSHDFKIRERNITLMPYYENVAIQYKEYTKNLFFKKKTSSKVINILVGNSAHNLSSYYKIAEMLSKIKRKDIHVSFMIQYPPLKEHEKEEFVHYLDTVLPHQYKLDNTMMTTQDYFTYIAQHDYYICGSARQSGLGAIYTALSLGLKVFLCGKNYLWAKERGYKIYSIDDICTKEHIDIKLASEEQMYNRNLYYELIESDKQKWIQYLSK